jgi:hypothetical protein
LPTFFKELIVYDEGKAGLVYGFVDAPTNVFTALQKFNKTVFCVLAHQNNCIFKSQIFSLTNCLQRNKLLTHQHLLKTCLKPTKLIFLVRFRRFMVRSNQTQFLKLSKKLLKKMLKTALFSLIVFKRDAQILKACYFRLILIKKLFL